VASGNLETEIKLRLASPEAARQAVERLGAALVRPRHFEANVLWDDASGSLRARGQVLRVRETDAGGVLTFKGLRREVEGVRAREEIETGVAEPARLRQILLVLGFRPLFRYEKYRTTYRWLEVEVVVDETPIGTFLEIEGPAAAIRAATEAMGFAPTDAITESYPALFLAAGGEGDMVFR